MVGERLSILQVNTTDAGGGAAQVARSLLSEYRSRGHESWLAVGYRQSRCGDVFAIPRALSAYRSLQTQRLHSRSALLGALVRDLRSVRSQQLLLGRALGKAEGLLGHEDFWYLGSRHIVVLPPQRPDIVHCHNLHGRYFDLRFLPQLSYQVPVAITLHDAWLLSGHCAHSFECERWRGGCGQCPDLAIYPSIRRDATALNWRRKRRIYARSRLYVATPSRWLMERVQQSMLAPAVVEGRVIPNGVDLAIFCRGDRMQARQRLGIPEDAAVLLFVANSIRANPWKDYETLRAALSAVAGEQWSGPLLCIALGERGCTQRVGQAELRFVPFQIDRATVAQYYRAADVYVHSARVDTFPNTVIEALACGVPVVAASVGGIPEQISDGETGFLVPSRDPGAMAERIMILLGDPGLRTRMSDAAAESAQQRFGLERQASAYLQWYGKIIERRT